MKAAVERACPRTVSCADMLTIAAQQSVTLAGGPSWRVPLGRRDSLQAFFSLSNDNLPSPFFTLPELKASFAKVGLDRPSDLVALSGGHTFGKNQCQFIIGRLYNFSNTGLPDPTLNTTYLQTLRGLCPLNGNPSALVDFDLRTPTIFDNKYYVNLKEQKGLIQTDQELLYNFSNTGLPDPTLNTTYLQTLRGLCPLNGNPSALVDFDLRTPTVFDNKYYVNLKEQKGLIQTDQELFSSPNATDTIPLVREYADGTQKFFDAFVEAMNRMGSITPLTGTQGEIRLNCRVVNSNSLLQDVVELVDFVSSI
ncbi:hypothetical protein F2Q70_00040528 [Brassica cretica]|uniref:Peroxidase n=1 Tax=Brassica cretica TaxID=69181 RepID=A0A8S9K139_BRACR|nr:hypothetical protein F2Q70_00040528 [Brassica cretica]